jgi:hypothetical protein
VYYTKIRQRVQQEKSDNRWHFALVFSSAGRLAVISNKSAGGCGEKSGKCKFFLFFLLQGVRSKTVGGFGLFFGTNAQVGLIVEGANMGWSMADVKFGIRVSPLCTQKVDRRKRETWYGI